MSRFVKLDAQGATLPADATAWAQVLDTSTKLIWMAEDVSGGEMDWADAKKAAEGVTLSDATWRLPTRVELLSLVDDTRHFPAIDTDFFPTCKSDWYWTATPAAYSPSDFAWFVYFSDGSSNWCSQSVEVDVRAVRSSQS